MVWVGLEGDNLLICTSDAVRKVKDMRRDPRVAVSVNRAGEPLSNGSDPRTGRDVRSDDGSRCMDPISIEYAGAPFPSRGPDRVSFVIAVGHAAQRTLGFVQSQPAHRR